MNIINSKLFCVYQEENISTDSGSEYIKRKIMNNFGYLVNIYSFDHCSEVLSYPRPLITLIISHTSMLK